MRSATLCLVSIFVLVLANLSFGDDLYPPSWRGQPGSTFGEWEFSTPDPNPLPDLGHYPWGPPTTQVTPGFLQSWVPSLNGRQGAWPLSGEIYVTIPNQPALNPYKDIQVQLTWTEQQPGNRPAVTETRFNVGSTLIHEIPLPGGWMHSTYLIHLEPNPDWERILISGGITVDEMVIDTICAPEPMTAGLLIVGAMLLRRRA